VLPTIEELVLLHFPSGAESEINQRLMEKFAALGVNAIVDRANNARIRLHRNYC
jgi:putative aminopeptidase FrvX